MKTTITSLFACCLLPAALMAQPTVSNNEFYNIGDVIQMVNCDTSGLNAGASGAGVTWDFTGLVNNGGTSTTTVAHDTSSVYLTDNLMETLPNGQVAYVKENSTDNYIDAIYDPASGETMSFNQYDEARRPFTYNTVVVDSYNVTISGSVTAHGNGFLTHTGDAYGTLKLPTGTYNNVLRIRKVQNESDTMTLPSTSFSGITAISYLWFDGTHAAPLLRIDSATSLSGESRSIMYLASALGVASVKSAALQYTAWFEDNALLLTGNFEGNKTYEVIVYDMIGAKILSRQFTGNGGPRFDAGRSVAPGIYIVSVADSNDPASREIIKIVKP